MIEINIDKLIQPLLQQQVVFSVNDKILKEGRLILFNVRDFHLCFYLKTDKGSNRLYELPYPYHITKHLNGVHLDYTLETLTKGATELMYRIKGLTKVRNSKLYDNILTISV